jgi:hypothetical protein
MKKAKVVESSEIVTRCSQCCDEIEQCDDCGSDFADDDVVYCSFANLAHYCTKCKKKA